MDLWCFGQDTIVLDVVDFGVFLVVFLGCFWYGFGVWSMVLWSGFMCVIDSSRACRKGVSLKRHTYLRSVSKDTLLYYGLYLKIQS